MSKSSFQEPRRAPKPPMTVGPFCVPSATTTPMITGTVIYQYSPDFPQEAHDRVRLAELEAKRRFNNAARDIKSEWPLRKMRITCLMQPTRLSRKNVFGSVGARGESTTVCVISL